MRRALPLMAALVAALVLGSGPPIAAQVIERGAIVVVSTGGGCTTFPPACAIFTLPTNTASATIQVSGTFTGTLAFEATADGTNWLAVTVINMADRSSTTTTTTAGNFAFANTGFLQFRLRATAFASGRAEITATRGFSSAALLGSSFVGGSFAGSTFTGTSTFTGPILATMGTGTAQATVVGTLDSQFASVSNTSIGAEDVLYTYTLPANTLAANGRGVRITWSANFAANANTKSARTYFGATAIGGSNFATAAPNGTFARFIAECFRVTATTQACSMLVNVGGTPFTVNTTPAETLSGPVLIQMRGQSATAAADVTGKSWLVEAF